MQLLLVVVFARALVGWGIDNGIGVTPPMGWRSWNSYGRRVNQTIIEGIMDGMSRRKWRVDGAPTSLCDLGYCDVGLDDSWQKCSKGAYNYHGDDGAPVINLKKFPDMAAMTAHAHKLGLRAGWYGNNCICAEHKKATRAMYEEDVKALVAFGFDSIKLDKCGSMQDLKLWAQLLNESGRPVMIENCHWGYTVPTATWCPWNIFRTSGDIRAQYGSMVSTLLTTVKWARAGLSRPGCWAYPDMMQVGCKHGPGGPSDPGMSLREARSHFGAWCIVSSPLILSHDVNNDAVMEEVWPIISNREAIAVNQAWAGHSGSPFKQSPENITLEGYADQTKKPILGDHGVAKGKETPLPSWHFFYKPLGGTRVAVLLMNHDKSDQTLTVHFADVPGLTCSPCSVRDVWLRQDLGSYDGSYTASLSSRDSAFLVLSPAALADNVQGDPAAADRDTVASLLDGGLPGARSQALAAAMAGALLAAGLFATSRACRWSGRKGRTKRSS